MRTHALLWVAKDDALGVGQRNGISIPRLLGISNPFGDARIKNWTGYSARRNFDQDGRVVEAGSPGAHEVELIPLALYASRLSESASLASRFSSLSICQAP